MPYISQRRLVCNRRWSAPALSSGPTARCGLRARSGASRLIPDQPVDPGISGTRLERTPGPSRRTTLSVEVQLRDARLTDIDRLVGLIERSDPQWSLEQLTNAGDVLRQMVYLPNAS